MQAAVIEGQIALGGLQRKRGSYDHRIIYVMVFGPHRFQLEDSEIPYEWNILVTGITQSGSRLK